VLGDEFRWQMRWEIRAFNVVKGCRMVDFSVRCLDRV
jgi:hypothetical protein